MKILVLNGGSSSFKCWYAAVSKDTLPEEAPEPEWRAHTGVETDLHKLLAEVPGGSA